MANKEKALAYMTQLGVMPEMIKGFKDGAIMQSTPHGILFWADEGQMAKAKDLEDAYPGTVVWHVISGTYVLGGIDRVEMDTYLLATDDSGDELEEYEKGQFYCFGYSDNLTWPDCSEYGEVVIAGENGGIVRKY